MGFVVLAQDYAVKGSGFIAYNLEKNNSRYIRILF